MLGGDAGATQSVGVITGVSAAIWRGSGFSISRSSGGDWGREPIGGDELSHPSKAKQRNAKSDGRSAHFLVERGQRQIAPLG